MYGRSSKEIEKEGAHSMRRDSEEPAGCVAMNSCWSRCSETERSEARSVLNPFKPFYNNSWKH